MKRQVDDFLLEQRRIFLWGDIDEKSAEEVVKSLRFCAADSKKDITLYIHSTGGDVECAEAILDEIAGCIKRGINVYTVAIGKAYSAACYILAMGSPQCRFATNLCSLMLHPVSCEIAEDYIHHQERATAFTRKKADDLFKTVAKACGKSSNAKIAAFKEQVEKTLWLTTKEAMKYGVIDGIWDYNWEDSN
jgi:ATP-dependent Clp protease protease subunit